MDEDLAAGLASLAAGIQKMKTMIPDIYNKPKILLAYLFDYFPDEEELLIKLAPSILSDISVLFYGQLLCGKFDSVQILKEASENSDANMSYMNMYLRTLYLVEGAEEFFTEYKTDAARADGKREYTINIKKSNEDISAEEYYQMACMQKSEKGIEDKALYVDLLKKASDKGHLAAKHSMALFYLKGKYVKQDIDRGFMELMECADNGYAGAGYEIYTFSKRYREIISENIAFDYLKKAAMAGMREAEYDLAMLYYENGADGDYKKAVELLRKCADKNDAGAMYQLALCYRYGHGTSPDIKKAMELLEKAAGLGHKRAKEIIALVIRKTL
ncbi:MAG: sel1 repeat family protein [Lachnospiraceae bacterium]|nr:sel1 repeat family protein [Lachnospiraceae bacterium]